MDERQRLRAQLDLLAPYAAVDWGAVLGNWADLSASAVDEQGQRREAYEPLRLVAALRWNGAGSVAARAKAIEVLESLEARKGASLFAPPAEVKYGPERAWNLAAAYELGAAAEKTVRQAWKRWLSATGPGLMPADARRHPEVYWYEELCCLHALASVAMRSQDRELLSGLEKLTLRANAEVEPDHASSQPWAIHAFLYHSQSQILGEQMLQACVLRRQHDRVVSRILLADAFGSLHASYDHADHYRIHRP